eukprot:7426637-Pyramimonas_sp.AAC.1
MPACAGWCKSQRLPRTRSRSGAVVIPSLVPVDPEKLALQSRNRVHHGRWGTLEHLGPASYLQQKLVDSILEPDLRTIQM